MSSLPEIAEKMQEALNERPLDCSIKFDCGDDGAITIDHDRALVEDLPADCTIKISEDNLVKLLTGKMNPMTAFAMGKIKISGDMTVAMKLSQLLG